MKAILYARKSTDTEDRQVLSLESQVSELTSLAEKDGIEVIDILTESRSAKEPGRPVFNDMMQRILIGEADTILCWKIDRLTRNPVDGGQIQWLLQTGKIQAITTFEKTYSPDDNVLIMSIEQAMATQYIRDLSLNVKRGNRAKLERGEWPNLAPYGYRNCKATKTIKVNRKQAVYVKRIFELYATGGYTLTDLVEQMYQDGMRTPAGYKVYKSQIHKILNQKFYTGLMEFRGTVYQGKHEPIVSMTLFNQVQDVFNHRQHPKQEKHFYSARGFMTCGVCGCTITADTKKGHQYYYCTNGKKVCTEHKKYMRSEHVDTILAGLFEELKIDSELIELSAAAYQAQNQQDDSYLMKAKENVENELLSLDQRESILVDGYTSGLIKRPLFEEKLKGIENERTVLQQQRQELAKTGPASTATFERIKSVFEQGNTASDEYINATDEAKRKLLETVLSNTLIKDQKVLQYKFKPEFQVLADTPKDAGFQQLRAVSS